MIAYMCKYAPVEVLEACGASVAIMEPDVANVTQAEAQMHPNMCSYVKTVLEAFEAGEYEGMLFTTCCDSARRLYDTLARRYPEKFFFCLDLPRKVNDSTTARYAEQMEQLIEAYTAFSGSAFDETRLADICAEKTVAAEQKAASDAQKTADLRVCLAGARPSPGVRELIEALGARITLDLTCTGLARTYDIASAVRVECPADCDGNAVSGERSDDSRRILLTRYTEALLHQLPCMRMAAVDARTEALLAQSRDLDGILYHTVKFCDIYSYEYTRFRETLDLPLVQLETDATSQCAGQIRTRVEAFLESLRSRKNNSDGPAPSHPSPTQGGPPMYIMGIDSGSTSTNAVIINEKQEIISYAVLRTGAKSADSAHRVRSEALEKAGLTPADIAAVVSTGYGRVSIPFADQNVTEISCHARGAHFLNPAVRTILDIGGQDSKAIRLNADGDVVDFAMNDKCAAGTGRFLEMMANTLEIGIEELGPLALQSKTNVEISSTCTVFAESEVISLIAQNKEPADIARGIHRAIAGKAMSLLKKVGLEETYMMTGGVAQNPGMVAVLEEMLGASLYIYEEPEIVGALGAALYGIKSV